MMLPSAEYIRDQVAGALTEDIGAGDISAALLENHPAKASIIAREQAVVCGIAWVEQTFMQCDPNIQIEWFVKDGDCVPPDSLWCRLEGNNRALLSAERTALNFLQLLSGVATGTNTLVKLVAGTGVKLLDTRKTIPGLRLAQKYAVAVGGGYNHRMGLFDQYLLKENHVHQCASIRAAIKAARIASPDAMLVVEVETLDQLAEAVAASPDRILLDNFSIPQILRAVSYVSGSLPLEISGGVNPKNLRSLARTGADYISIGGLTKHVKAIDLAMRLGV